MGLRLCDDIDEHSIPTNTIELQDVCENPLGIEIEPEPLPGEKPVALPWTPQVGGFAVYQGLLVEIDDISEHGTSFSDGVGGIWLHAPSSLLSCPTAALWAAQIDREVSWRGAPATVEGIYDGSVWLRCGPRRIGVPPEAVDPPKW